MAPQALINEYVVINGVNVSAYLKKAILNYDPEALDSTGMGGGGAKAYVGGLKDGQLDLEMMDDYAAAALDATLWPLLGTVVPFEVRADSGAVSTSNPKYTGSVFIGGHSVGGTLGQLPMKSPTYKTSGLITRATA